MIKKFITCLLVTFDLFSAHLLAQDFEGKGAESPQKSVERYLDALQKCDYNQIISCYSVETFVKNYDIAEYVKKMSCASPVMKMVDSRCTLLKQTGKYEVLDSITKMIKYQIWNLSENDFFKRGKTVMVMDDVQNVVERVIPSNAEKRLGKIKFSNEFISIDDILSYLISSNSSANVSDYADSLASLKKRMKEAHVITKKIYGCKDIQDVVASFDINGKKYLYITETIKYENKWYLSPNQGFLASLLGLAVSNGCIVEADEIFN